MSYGIARVIIASFSVLLVLGCTPKAPPPPPPPPVAEVRTEPAPPPEPPAPSTDIKAKKGKRYGKAKDPSIKRDGYEERGVASWYGPSFDGSPTACGEVFDMYGLSAAHKLLPMHTVVEVTNLENGRKVTLPINDRGPYITGRVLDLSYGAALKLGMTERGLCRVSIRTKEPVRGAVKNDLVGNFFVHIGAFEQQQDAEALLADMRREGHRRLAVVRSERGDAALWRVQMGPYQNLLAAEKARDKLVEGYPSAFVVAGDSATVAEADK